MSIFGSIVGNSKSSAPAVQYLPFGMAADQIGLNRRFSSPNLSVQGGQFTGTQAFNPGLMGAQNDFLSRAGGLRTDLRTLNNEFTGNQNAFINARVNPLRQNIATQRGGMQRDFGRRGVMGSIANREMSGFEFDANRALGDATSLATADSLAARQSILSQEQQLAEREFATRFGVNQEQFSRELQGLGLGIETITGLLSLAGNLSANTANAALNKGRLDDAASADRRQNIGNMISTGSDLWDAGKKAYDFFSEGSAGSQGTLGNGSTLRTLGKETLGKTGSWADLGTGPNKIPSGQYSPGFNSLAGSGWAAAGPQASGAITYAAPQAGGGGVATQIGTNWAATGTGGTAGATAGTGAAAPTTGAGAAASGLLKAAGIGGLMIAGMSLISNANGSAADKAKTQKLFRQFESNPQEGYKALDNIISGKMWTGEDTTNIKFALNPSFDAGVIDAAYPTLHSSQSKLDLWNIDPATGYKKGLSQQDILHEKNKKFYPADAQVSPTAIAQMYGLNSTKTAQYKKSLDAYNKAMGSIKYVGDDTEDSAHWMVATGEGNWQRLELRQFDGTNFSQFDLNEGFIPRAAQNVVSEYLSAKKSHEGFIKANMTEGRKKQSAQSMYQKLRSAGYRGDLGKLESYIGVK
jgi:hypothetical protein